MTSADFLCIFLICEESFWWIVVIPNILIFFFFLFFFLNLSGVVWGVVAISGRHVAALSLQKHPTQQGTCNTHTVPNNVIVNARSATRSCLEKSLCLYFIFSADHRCWP
jgi:hypothetical protein